MKVNIDIKTHCEGIPRIYKEDLLCRSLVPRGLVGSSWPNFIINNKTKSETQVPSFLLLC